MAKHIALIGMMGSGKSTVAPILAAGLKRDVIEVDALIEKNEGMPIGEIFIARGEAHFRRAEGEIISGLLAQSPAVLSLGGGAFQWEATRTLLLAHAIVFYLSASADVLTGRLRAGTAERPLLSMPGVDWQETVRDLLERRNANYNLAHYRVATDNNTPDEVAHSILLLREAYD